MDDRETRSAKEAKDILKRFVQENRADLIDLLRELVQTPSVTGDEGQVQGILRKRFVSHGLSVDGWTPDMAQLKAHPAYVPVDYSNYEKRPNLAVTIKGTGGGRSLILNGHVDVVPTGPAEKWHYGGPWSGTIKEGNLYGRGACDMKGGVAAIALAVEALHTTGIRLKGSLVAEYVVDEEAGGNGTLSSCLRGYRADAVIICEPTNLSICPAHRGAQFFRITTTGKGAHAGIRFEGVSALEKMFYVIEAIGEFERKRDLMGKRNPLYSSYELSSPVTVGRITGGDWPAKVPERCSIEGMIDLMPGESVESVRQEFLDWLCKEVVKDEWLRINSPVVEWPGVSMRGVETPIDHPILAVISKNARDIASRNVNIVGFPAGSDLRLFEEALEMKGVLFGPGDLRYAHAVNEMVPVDQVVACAKILAMTIVDWCGVADY
jgi:acetylornithine deacetylase